MEENLADSHSMWTVNCRQTLALFTSCPPIPFQWFIINAAFFMRLPWRGRRRKRLVGVRILLPTLSLTQR